MVTLILASTSVAGNYLYPLNSNGTGFCPPSNLTHFIGFTFDDAQCQIDTLYFLMLMNHGRRPVLPILPQLIFHHIRRSH